MKGLLKKDLIYMLDQKLLFIILIAFSLSVVFFSNNPDFSKGFAVGYITFIFGVRAAATISYDDADNGMAYPMSMPVTRSMYVNEKYLASVIASGLSGVFCTIIYAIIDWKFDGGFDFKFLVYLFIILTVVGIVMNSIGIPAFIKFGGQKGMIAMILAMAGIVLVVVALGKLLSMAGLLDLDDLGRTLEGLNIGEGVALIVAIGGVLMAISYFISTKVMRNKEF